MVASAMTVLAALKPSSLIIDHMGIYQKMSKRVWRKPLTHLSDLLDGTVAAWFGFRNARTTQVACSGMPILQDLPSARGQPISIDQLESVSVFL